MLIQHRKWKEIVNTKTKRLTGLSILRWTLIQHATRSLKSLNDVDLRRKLLVEEMIWLNQFWGQPVPKKEISSKYWKRLIEVDSLNVRRDLYEYLFDDERRRDKFEEKLRTKIEARPSDEQRINELQSTTIFATWLKRRNVRRSFDHNLLLQAARLNDYFVVDGGFEYAHHRHSYLSSLIQRVFRCYKHFDRFHSPSYIVITDLEHRFREKTLSQTYEQSNHFHLTDELYLDLFDRDRLIYLTPDSPNEMTHFEHDAVYILGGIYDDQNKQPLTLDKARRQNIRHLRLPIDQYLTFHPTSSRALAFHEVYNIVQSLKHNQNNWPEALRYVPDRKVAYRIEQSLSFDDCQSFE